MSQQPLLTHLLRRPLRLSSPSSTAAFARHRTISNRPHARLASTSASAPSAPSPNTQTQPKPKPKPKATSLRPESYSSSFSQRPSPPPLPREDQALFEHLQQTAHASVSSSSSAQDPRLFASASTSTSTSANSAREGSKGDKETGRVGGEEAQGSGRKETTEQQLHPDARRGSPLEFEGDRNPRTGEVGGPKREPLRWGDRGDWSYNGRVTDF